MQPQSRCSALESSDVCVNSIRDFKIQSELLIIGGSLCAEVREDEEKVFRERNETERECSLCDRLPLRTSADQKNRLRTRSTFRLNVLNRTESDSVHSSSARNFPINEISRL